MSAPVFVEITLAITVAETPSLPAVIELIVMLIVWFVLAPTWSFLFLKLPERSPIVLNCVWVAIRLISDVRALTSLAIALRSAETLVSFEAWTVSSLILWSTEWISLKAPSAVWISDWPSSAFVEACSRPLICPLIFSLIERPAASSAARFTL